MIDYPSSNGMDAVHSHFGSNHFLLKRTASLPYFVAMTSTAEDDPLSVAISFVQTVWDSLRAEALSPYEASPVTHSHSEALPPSPSTLPPIRRLCPFGGVGPMSLRDPL